MCNIISAALEQVPLASRRRLLQGAGLAMLGTVGAALTAAPSPALAASAGKRARTRLVLLGTAGGPNILTDQRLGVSTAVVYEDKVYLVDLGHGSQVRLLSAGLAGDGFGGNAFSNVRGIFFTHLHSDHVAEWPAVYSTGSMNMINGTNAPVQVFGPGNRGTLTRVFPPNRPEPEVFNPSNPAPGITEMTGYLRQAFSADLNDRARDSNVRSPDASFAVHDIDLAGLWDVDPAGIPPRLNSPIQVWRDGEVTVTATLVDHRPTAPAFAYRFQTPDGSVVVSGDTCVSENLIDLAKDADYLVHEVIDPDFADQLAASLPPAWGQAVKEHLLASHTTIEQVGRDVAEPSGAKNLVLSHLVPATTPDRRWRQAQHGYSGKLHVGKDLMSFDVEKR